MTKTKGLRDILEDVRYFDPLDDQEYELFLNKIITQIKSYLKKNIVPKEIYCVKHVEENCQICDEAIRIWNNCRKTVIEGINKL